MVWGRRCRCPCHGACQGPLARSGRRGAGQAAATGSSPQAGDSLGDCGSDRPAAARCCWDPEGHEASQEDRYWRRSDGVWRPRPPVCERAGRLGMCTVPPRREYGSLSTIFGATEVQWRSRGANPRVPPPAVFEWRSVVRAVRELYDPFAQGVGEGVPRPGSIDGRSQCSPSPSSGTATNNGRALDGTSWAEARRPPEEHGRGLAAGSGHAHGCGL